MPEQALEVGQQAIYKAISKEQALKMGQEASEGCSKLLVRSVFTWKA